jgi:molybdate transport system ATP-binding protein
MIELSFDCRLRRPSGFELAMRFEAGTGVTALVGPSGSGKTTALSLIAGLLRPDAGSIRLNGSVLTDRAAGVFVRPEDRRVGCVFQEQLLFPHLSVRQNLLFGHGRRSSRPMDFGRVVSVLEIGELLSRRPDTLSGGQRQRVALGRALLRGPELLLMDEPLAALHVELKDRILTYLERAIQEWRIPTLVVSHDPADVRRLDDQVVVVDSGKVLASGSPAQVMDELPTSGNEPG